MVFWSVKSPTADDYTIFRWCSCRTDSKVCLSTGDFRVLCWRVCCDCRFRNFAAGWTRGKKHDLSFQHFTPHSWMYRLATLIIRTLRISVHLMQGIVAEINHAIGATGIVSGECKLVVQQYADLIIRLLTSEVNDIHIVLWNPEWFLLIVHRWDLHGWSALSHILYNLRVTNSCLDRFLTAQSTENLR